MKATSCCLRISEKKGGQKILGMSMCLFYPLISTGFGAKRVLGWAI